MKIAETQKAVIAKHNDPALNPAQLPIYTDSFLSL